MKVKHETQWFALMACVAALALPGCGGGGGGDNGSVNLSGADGSNSAAGGDGGGTMTSNGNGSNTNGDGATTGSNNGGSTDNSSNGGTFPNWSEGAWQGPATNGDTDALVILHNGEVWGVYGKVQSMTYYISGMFHGSSNTSNLNQISGALTRFDLTDFTPNANYNFSGTVMSGTTLNIAFNGANLAARYDSDYTLRLPLSSHYAGTVSTHDGVVRQTLNISDSTVNMPADANGCSASGAIAPYSSYATGVYNISLTFNGANCPLGDGTTVQGILFQKLTGIRVMAVTPDGQRGFLFLG